jgi:hypothetical protein
MLKSQKFLKMRTLINSFESQFENLDGRLRRLIKNTPESKLFFQPPEIALDFPAHSAGSIILRSAGRVEQTFNGMTAKLWDDPFEWTLPETLSTTDLILEYLDETKKIRQTGFSLLKSDEDLRRELPAPEKLKTIFEILLETIAEAESLNGQAILIYQFLKNPKSKI